MSDVSNDTVIALSAMLAARTAEIRWVSDFFIAAYAVEHTPAEKPPCITNCTTSGIFGLLAPVKLILTIFPEFSTKAC